MLWTSNKNENVFFFSDVSMLCIRVWLNAEYLERFRVQGGHTLSGRPEVQSLRLTKALGQFDGMSNGRSPDLRNNGGY